MNADHRYRICSSCDEIWNVSKIDKLDKRYICPRCENRSKKMRAIGRKDDADDCVSRTKLQPRSKGI